MDIDIEIHIVLKLLLEFFLGRVIEFDRERLLHHMYVVHVLFNACNGFLQIVILWHKTFQYEDTGVRYEPLSYFPANRHEFRQTVFTLGAIDLHEERVIHHDNSNFEVNKIKIK